MGPYNSMWGAQKVADKLESEYQIEKLPTLSAAKATQLVKQILIEKHPEKFSEYVKRMRHPKEKGEKGK